MRSHQAAFNGSTAATFDNHISEHATDRLHERCITREQIDLVIRFGRMAHVRGAVIYAIGRREMEQLRRLGLASDRLEGLQVVCDPWSDTVITAYRNSDLSSLRRKSRYFDRRPHHGDNYLMAA